MTGATAPTTLTAPPFPEALKADNQLQDVEENPGNPPSSKNSGNVASRKSGLDHYRKGQEDKNQGSEQAQYRAHQEDYPTLSAVQARQDPYRGASKG
jgi:hypothetical protein